MAGGIEPERALALPYLQRVRRFAGPPALIAGAAWAVILRVRRSQIGAETKAFIGTARSGRSGLPSPEAMLSPRPAMKMSRTAISVETRWLPSDPLETSTVATVVRP